LGNEDIKTNFYSYYWEFKDIRKAFNATVDDYKKEKRYQEFKKQIQKEVTRAEKSGELYSVTTTEKDNEEYYEKLNDPEQAKIARWIIDEGYTETKIAKFLGISQPTVHRKKEKAFENLRQIAFKKNPWLKFKYGNLKRGENQ
jgi:DNA-directed RNA polymerase specialized sigma subunit